MKIAFFHELHAGGARRTVNEFAKRLKQNHTVDLYIVDEEIPSEEKKLFTTIFLSQFIPKKWHGGNWKVRLYKDTIELYTLYKLHKKIASAIDSRNYDFVFIHPSQYTQAPFILRFIKTKKTYYSPETLRMVYEEHFALPKINSVKIIYEDLMRLVRKKIDKTNISYADVILTNSKHSKESIKNAYGLKSEVCYLGVDQNIFTPSHEGKKYDVLFLGSLDAIDRYALLEKAVSFIKKKPTIKTHISGKDWINDDHDLSRLYARAKVVMCLAKNEPFGLIPLEAMACGIPVIAVAEGGYKETVINNSTGFLIPPDPHVLAQKLTLLLKNDTIRQQMGKKARYIILKHWTWEESLKRLEKFMKV